MAIYNGCARDHHGHQFKCYASPELVFPENTVAEIPLRNSVKVLAAMPAGHQPSNGHHRQVPSCIEPQVPDQRLRIFLKSPRSQS